MKYLFESLKTPTRLYIKKCSHCELKYFGKTTRRRIENYRGSGKKWLSHLRKHNANSIHLWNSKWYYDTSIIRFATKFSNINKIAESKNWANLKPEDGINTGGGKLSEDAYKRISEKTKGVSRPWSRETMKKHHEKIRKGEVINPHTKRWEITDPQGIIYILDSLGEFCKERNISHGNLSTFGKTKGYTAKCLGYTRDFKNLQSQEAGAVAASR